MIRINLLKNVNKKTAVKKAAISAWVPAGIGILVVLILAGGARMWFLKTQKKPQAHPVVIEQKTEFKPSTHVKPDMIEEVVKEVNDERKNNQKIGFINLAYDEMSFGEKINYEILFGKIILDSLSKMIPSGIGFKTLEIDNFSTMYCVGLGNNSTVVTKTFSLLKEHMGLLPKPYSHINENGKLGYKFIFTCKPQFGIDLVNPYQPFDHLFSSDMLSEKISRFTAVAAQNKLHFKSKPVSKTVNKIRDYKRFEYEWKCTGHYNNFVQFMSNLYQEQLPIAFKSIHINAKTVNNVEILTTLILTVKE